jgi:ATP-dependent protease Clp ATPase subunit
LFILILKEKILLEAMFEVPESDIVCVKIDEDVILGKKPIEYVRSSARTHEDIESDKISDNLDAEQESKAKTYA